MGGSERTNLTPAPSVAVERLPRVATIAFGPLSDGRPAMWAELERTCREFARDEQLLAIVVAGNLGFSRADVAEDHPRLRSTAVEAVAALPQVTVGVIEGAAAGPGLEIALACDLRLASTAAVLSFPEVQHGRIPGASVTQRLPRIVGHARAAELILTSSSVDATEAHSIGLVHHVVPPEDLDGLIKRTVDSITKGAPIALRLAKEALRLGEDMSLESALVFEHDLYLLLQTTRDRHEGLSAFREGREPEFNGT